MIFQNYKDLKTVDFPTENIGNPEKCRESLKNDDKQFLRYRKMFGRKNIWS